MKKQPMTLAACIAAILLCQASFTAFAAQVTPAPATASSTSQSESTSADVPASVDEDRPQPTPRYSATMKNTGGTGTVIVMVQVGPDNKAKSFHVMMSSGSKALDDEAVRTLKGWSYKAAMKNGVPADGYVQIPITFNK